MSVESANQWDELVKRLNAAQNEANSIQEMINKKFQAIASGTSRENPTMDELLNADVAYATVTQIRREMQDFIAVNFPAHP